MIPIRVKFLSSVQNEAKAKAILELDAYRQAHPRLAFEPRTLLEVQQKREFAALEAKVAEFGDESCWFEGDVITFVGADREAEAIVQVGDKLVCVPISNLSVVTPTIPVEPVSADEIPVDLDQKAEG